MEDEFFGLVEVLGFWVSEEHVFFEGLYLDFGYDLAHEHRDFLENWLVVLVVADDCVEEDEAGVFVGVLQA